MGVRGYRKKCAPKRIQSCDTKIVARVKPTIISTSQPFQTGFSTGGGPIGIAAVGIATLGSGAWEPAIAESVPGTGVCAAGSPFTVLCGPNCGLSDVDKLSVSLLHTGGSSGLATRYTVLGTGFSR